ncbi:MULTISPECIES: glycosyltransferase [unclassified Pseudomonas]|uniref:glycosyltransferase n=1 Tax=unclassified Pseudomonas TaxID=196821 RepID=UPI00089BC441|nr:MULTISPECIES: glycosyltransferase [unclassified Pseudomonas]SDW07843.1 Glycosyltransferase involved in cell wall bisynthesis [Pseudomonas sp. NFACC08-1]SFL54934.1 Glycosyltransferase involved in cell wall bisynthesis [Pseudomonas sp. NFACC46-3]
MNFILYSDVNDLSVGQALDCVENSPYLLLTAYRPMLESLGRVHVVSSVAEVDPLYQRFQEAGQDCLFLSFSPPHNTPTDLLCPMVCVLAWAFDSIPTEHFGDDPGRDWRRTLNRHGRVIALSGHAAEAIRRALGEDFPVLVLPAPLWERFAVVREQYPSRPVNPGMALHIKGCIIDSRFLGLSADGLIAPLIEERPEQVFTAPEVVIEPVIEPPVPTWRRRGFISRHYLREIFRAFNSDGEQGTLWLIKHNLLCWYREAVRDLMPVFARVLLSRVLRGTPAPPVTVVVEPLPEPVREPVPPEHPQAVLPDTSQTAETEVSGVVYVSVLDPLDGQKNWLHLITAFCWALRDVEDATLLLKITQKDLSAYYVELLTLLSQLSPFNCRVVVLHGDLADEQLIRLYGAATYYVNASRCEGVCLPLMEYMSCARPAIAPDHTAMRDYIDAEVAFVVKSSREPTPWPQDTRLLYRTLSYRPDWGSLKQAYQQSYAMARHQPNAYQAMASAASERMRRHCDFAPAEQRLAAFLAGPSRDETPAFIVQPGSVSC